MSRIYEALQRANLERKSAPQCEDDQLIDQAAIPQIEEPQPAKEEVAIEDVATYPWSPSVGSFPTLEDRGEGVEQFRALRTKIYQARYQAPLKTILVCSG